MSYWVMTASSSAVSPFPGTVVAGPPPFAGTVKIGT